MSSGGTESTNPFLIGFSEPARYETVYNPFALPEATDSSTSSSNPFLIEANITYSDNASSQPSSCTNPFAQFLIGDATPNTSVATTFNAQETIYNFVTSSAPTPQSRKSSLSYESDSGKRSPPRRPPPPRPTAAVQPIVPQPHPPEETKELILSVTGALEQTSTDLLDRLQVTRTPSPTPLRDLDSPSPTHMMQVNDLMGDDDLQVPMQNHGAGHADIQQEAINIFDAIANLSREHENKGNFAEVLRTPAAPASTPASIISPAPTPAAPPPIPPHRPPPPQVPESPYMSRKSSLESAHSSRRSSTDKMNSVGPPLPVPPVVAQSTWSTDSTKSQDSGNGIQTLQGLPFNYLATRKTSHDITASRMQAIPSGKKYSLDYSSTLGEQAIIKEQLEQYSTVISPSIESPIISPSQEDNAPILETPKFPVISTTPIMSYENISNECLCEQDSTEKEPSLIFDEAIEKQSANESFSVSTPDPFSTCSQVAASDMFVTGMNAAKDDFDQFDEKFASVNQSEIKQMSGQAFDPFGDSTAPAPGVQDGFSADGFDNEAPFDEFLATSHLQESFANTANQSNYYSAQQWPEAQYQDTSASQWGEFPSQPAMLPPTTLGDSFSAGRVSKTDSIETPPTPLFDEDVSQPLEPFPRTEYTGLGWEMQIRYPIKKKFTGQRFWKKVFVKLVYQGGIPHLEVLSKDEKKETLLHEWPLQPCYAISDIGAQQYDHFGKIFTVKIQFVVYKERPGVRPGQVTKAERLTNKLSQFASYAIQGDYQGVKEFGSDLKKLGLPVEHSPQISLICKLGSHNYEDMKQFSICVEDALFKLSAHRDNIHVNYKFEEVQITAVDELYVEQNAAGAIIKQIARVRLFFLGFLTGMPDIEIGVNDLWRQGKEVVGRHDIIPVVTEEWIRLENVVFHSCIQKDVYEETRTIKFKPPDQCYLELMRFRVRPPKNRELPLQVKTVFRVCGNKVDIYSDILVPGFTSRKLGQIPCEDVVVRIPIPECWIYLFRTEKHFRYGSVKSAHRRTGKIKGIERFLGAVDTLEQHLIEVTSGHAKYEHHHRAIVWRMSRLPKEGQGAYTTHNLVCHLALTSYDQVPEELAKHCYVEFTMPVTQVSHTTVRSVSISNSDSDSPPEKCVRHLARHEYIVEIQHTHAESTNEYLAATMVKPKPATAAPPKQPLELVPDSESDSD